MRLYWTGKSKRGLIRRDTLLKDLRERGWEIIPVDVGNQVRRIGRQPELKFQSTVEAFRTMGYRAAALGIDDLRLSSIELIQMAGSDGLNESPFLSANVSVIDESFFPSLRIIEAGGRKIGITAVLGKEHESEIQSRDILYFDAVEKLKPVVQQLEQEGCDFKVLLAHASIEESAELARQVPGFDLVVTAGGFGEPTLTPEKSKARRRLWSKSAPRACMEELSVSTRTPNSPFAIRKSPSPVNSKIPNACWKSLLAISSG
ncbi:MAG: hypothetical protein R3C56_00860 [Pirellulaceae bacterium]